MQTPKSQTNHKQGSVFHILLFLTGFLVLAEISFVVLMSGMYLSDFKFISNHLTIPLLVILPGVLFFIAAQLLVHVGFAGFVWWLTRGVGFILRLSWRTIEEVGLGLWFFTLFTVLITNRFYYPNSEFSKELLSWLKSPYLEAVFLICCIGLFFVSLIAMMGWLTRVLIYKRTSIFLGVLSLLTVSGVAFSPKQLVTDAGSVDKPNIIIIGIDSLRPDYLGFFGYGHLTQHLDHFLNHATVFSESLTPLARTFPAWHSVLTGKYPKLTGVRTDLSNLDNIDLTDTLSSILKRNGYKTLFITDESRFSNIDERYDFDKVIVPPIGFNDFLLGNMNDFPISNLLVNTVIGEYLFPHSFANRAVYAEYNPNSFLKKIAPILATPRDKPELIITHFCLPHFPYAWSATPVSKLSVSYYKAAIARVDLQFHDYMAMLKQDGLLKNSIVIVLSDHGEAVEMAGDRITDPELFIRGKHDPSHKIRRFYPISSAREKVNTSGGHGTDVLGLPQYHTVLAFRTFGARPNHEKTVPGIVSLMDIKPTILDYLHLPVGKLSGVSLQNIIFGSQNSATAPENFYIESDFSPTAVRTVHPEMRKVLFEGIDYFTIDPVTARIRVRDNMLKLIISSKQYADFSGHWELALYPQKNKQMIPILVNLETGEWTDDLTTAFALHSPANKMLASMKLFFGNDITNIT